jgi:hypothetical protein
MNRIVVMFLFAALLGASASAAVFRSEMVTGISIAKEEIFVGDKAARVGDTIGMTSESGHASYRLVSVAREGIRLINKDTGERIQCPLIIVPEWEQTKDGTWLKGIELNDLLSILASKAGQKYRYNIWLCGKKVTGRLDDGDPFENVRSLCPQYGLALYIKQNTLFALTNGQQAKIPRSILACTSNIPLSNDLIEQIKPLLSPNGIVNYDPIKGQVVLCDTPVVVGAVNRLLGQIASPTAKVAISINVFSSQKNRGRKRLASTRLLANNGELIEWRDSAHDIAIGIIPTLLPNGKVSLRIAPRVESKATKSLPYQIAASEVCGIIGVGETFHFDGLFQRETTRLVLCSQTMESNVRFDIAANQQL